MYNEAMRIYFCGIGGTGIGPLAQMALDAGYQVLGSDRTSSAATESLTRQGIEVSVDQSGDNLRQAHTDQPIDLFVYSSGIPADHAELVLARQLGIPTVKRDELINQIIADHGLKLVAIAGTHGKTTTTAMTVWALQQLGIPTSYLVGSTLSFGPSGRFNPGSEYFIYECDEYDRNFLHFSPYLSLITAIDYDHPDTYPTRLDYTAAFRQFLDQSEQTIMWQRDANIIDITANDQTQLLRDDETLQVNLAGDHNRRNATLVAKALEHINVGDPAEITKHLASYPGSGRRFEKLADNLYSDYGHHPSEIAATLELARELSDHVVLVYQPHQNIRQHNIRDLYRDSMVLADTIYWLPTYLTREDPALEVLTPEQLTVDLENRDNVRYADLDDNLWQNITRERQAGKLVLAMGAGTIDDWLRSQFVDSSTDPTSQQ